MKLQEYELKLQELRDKWKKASGVERKIIEGRAKLIKRAIEEYQSSDPLVQYAIDIFT